MSQPVILTCALTGSIHTPSMSPHLPITPEELIEQGLAAAEAGATILHLHARDPQDGRPTADPAVFRQFLPALKQHSDVILNLSTGGSSRMPLAERMQAALQTEPEMCSLNMGSMNFGIFPLAERYSDWQHAWETELLEGSRDTVFKNTFADIETLLTQLGQQRGVHFEFECYDVGHIHSLAWYVRQQQVQTPVFLQFVLGVLGGIDAAPEQLMHMKNTADRLLGAENYHFSVLAAGLKQMPLGTMGAIMGGHVRIGLEDSLYLNKGQLAPSNAAQVHQIRHILEALGYRLASPAEARQQLGLKGKQQVNF